MTNRWVIWAVGLMCLNLTSLRLAVAQDASAKQPLKRNVKIVNVATGKVLTVEDDATDSGARAVLNKDNDESARQWKLEADGDYLKLTNRKSELALDVSGESTDDGGIIIVWDDKAADGNDNQRWTWEPNKKAKPGADGGKPTADSLFSEAGGKLKSKSSGLVLNVDSDGGIIQSNPDDSAKSQLWRIVEVPAYFKIVNLASGKSLGVADDSVENEAQATLIGGVAGKENDLKSREVARRENWRGASIHQPQKWQGAGRLGLVE